MNCLSISHRGKSDLPSAWIRPSEAGLAMLPQDESAVPSITSYLAARGGRCFSIVDEATRNEDGSVTLSEREASPSYDGYFPAMARKLTFHPGNTDQWIFRPASLKPNAFLGAKLIAGRDCICDLFKVQPIQTLPQCKCLCGASYPAGSKRCPSCGGDDPLGWALSVCGQNPAPKLSNQVPSNGDLTSNHPDLQKLLSSLKSFVDRAEQPPQGDVSKPNKASAKILLDYFKRLFSMPSVTDKSFKSLSKLREKTYLSIVLNCASRAATVRRFWRPATLSAWMPDLGFQALKKRRILHWFFIGAFILAVVVALLWLVLR